MTEQELERELELYQGMYYTLFNAVTDVIEVTTHGCVKDYLQKAVYRSKDILLNEERPDLTKRECADLLRRFVDGTIKNKILIAPEFLTMCVDKILELDDIAPPSNESVNEGFAELRQKSQEAEREFNNRNK